MRLFYDMALVERPTSEASPRISVPVSGERQPRVGVDPGSIYQLRMTWCLTFADLRGTWSWGQSRAWTTEEWCAVLQPALQSFSKLTWAEIERQAAHGHRKHHSQLVGSLIAEAQARWGECGFEADEAYRFRVGAKERVWGFRAGSHFHVVWFDPEHLIYPTEKKNL